MFDPDRFVQAQDHDATYDRALAELRHGRKRSHWMWFVFPQVAGLGQSPTSRHFAISGLAEARAYLAHEVLGPRLVGAAGVVLEAPAHSAEQIFGSLDAEKLRSSMTLFHRADPECKVFRQVLDRFFGGEPDPATVRLLEGVGQSAQ